MGQYQVLRNRNDGRTYRVARLTLEVNGRVPSKNWILIACNPLTHTPMEMWPANISFPMISPDCKTTKQVENYLLTHASQYWEQSGGGTI